jgi:hypothetical protein
MSNDRDRDDRGQYAERVTPEQILAYLGRVYEPVTATDIGAEFGVTNRTALNKLDRLHEQGTIERKEVGARAVVWWLDESATGENSTADEYADDPLFELPTAASGRQDVSENVDTHVATALSDEE